MKHIESDDQKALFIVMSMHLKRYPELEGAFAIPNGGKRDAREAMRLKAEGVRPGIPDIFIPAARGKYHGLFIEMKSPKGKVSEYQENMLVLLNSFGYLAIVAYGWEDAWIKIQKYFDWGDA